MDGFLSHPIFLIYIYILYIYRNFYVLDMKLFSLMSTAFDNFDDTIKAYLSRTLGSIGIQYTHSQIFGVIFDGLRGVMQNVMFYIEDAMTEQNIFTATRQKSVYSLAKLSGYSPYYGAAAKGTIIFQSKANTELYNNISKIYIKNHTRLLNMKNGLPYIVILPTDFYVIDLSKPIVQHEVSIIQGTLETSKYIARGYVWETITIQTNDLWDNEYFSITVNGELWTRQYSIYDMSENGKEYILNTGYDGNLEIMFGNGMYGKTLVNGQNVEIRYIRHVGAAGNITTTSLPAFRIQTGTYDSLGNAVNGNTYLNVTMQNPIVGGVNSDSIKFIRQMVGYNSRSLVLASEQNFILFFRRFSFVSYVNCWSEHNSMCITATCMGNELNNIHSVNEYYNIDPKKLLLTEDQKEIIEQTLANSQRTFAGVTLKFQDPLIRQYAFICYVKIDSIYNKDVVKQGIESSLAKYFMEMIDTMCTNMSEGDMLSDNLSSTSYSVYNKKFIAKSDIIKRVLDDNANIKSLTIDIISQLGEQTFYNGYYDSHELKLINGIYKYVPRRVMYEPDKVPGLDTFGNILLDSDLEVPILHGGFDYYYDKPDKNKSLKIPSVQVYFMS